jgi:hypothetical protein
MGKLVIYLILLLFLSNNCFSQTEITGQIIDKETNKGINANVILKNTSGKIISYTRTENEGVFVLKGFPIGIYNLQITSISYETQIVKIDLSEQKSINLGKVYANSKTTVLNEVVVQTRKPIVVKNDTVAFDAKSFLQGNEQVVEDLLKKIPGLTVESDGTIKIENKEVEKVMVDGDDFFEKGYKILTKNMPVHPIDKVEIYQHYSANKHLKGIENSEKVALNLTLKEDAKRVWFGNVDVGNNFREENRYEVRANLMNLGKTSKHYFLTNLNNIGMDAVGDVSHLVKPFRADEAMAVGDNQSANPFINLNFEQPNLKLLTS